MERFHTVITGASKGIGKALANEMASRGSNLLLIARSEDLLSTLCSDLKRRYSIDAKFLVCDLELPGAADEVFESSNRLNLKINGLINNAGYTTWGRYDKEPRQAFRDMQQLNVSACLELTHLFLPSLLAAPNGHLVFIASTASFQPTPYMALYGAGKALLRNFSRAIHHELRKTNVSVSCVFPGPTYSEMYIRVGEPELQRRAGKKQMTAERVAKIAVNGMLKGRAEITPGLMNKLNKIVSDIIPRGISTPIAGRILRKDYKEI